MAQTPGDERERLLSEARAAHREAARARSRARKLAGRYIRKLRNSLAAARAKIEADRATVDAKIAKLNQTQSDFHAASATDRDQLRDAWAALEARQARLTEEWEEVNRFQAEQAAAIATRAAELNTREQAEAALRARLQKEMIALREEAAALDVRISNARTVVEELEKRRAELYAKAGVPTTPGTETPAIVELQIPLDRAADRDLAQWSLDLETREAQLNQERAALQTHLTTLTQEKADLDDRRRVLAEQFSQLTVARVQWQEAEQATVAELEQLATTLRHREAELDARQQCLVRADSRRREDSYELWQLRLRLEAWQSKIVAYEMRFHTEREAFEAGLSRREAELTRRQSQLSAGTPGEDADVIPFASAVPESVPASMELTALRNELERMAEVLLEAELPEAPDGQLPWGSEEGFEIPMALPEEEEADVLPFIPTAWAA